MSLVDQNIFTTKLFIKLLHSEAKMPVQSKDDSGFDVYCIGNYMLEPNTTTLISTGIAYATKPMPLNDPECMWSINTKIEGRSSLASKDVFPVGGIVDPSYRGEIKVCLFNGGRKRYEINSGDKVAQLVLYPILANKNNHQVVFEAVDWQEKTDRGSGGFGSTGR